MRPQFIDIHQALVDRCRTGDSRAQHELYRLYSRAMYNVSMHIVNDAGEAEDVLQESFLQAFSNIREYRAEATFGAWLKKIVVNRSVNCLRRKKLQLFDEVPGTDTLVHEDTATDTEEWEVQRVHKAIKELPDGYRLVLTLYLLEGYDHEEIAQILNITVSTSKSQYNRAKARVKEQLMAGQKARLKT